MRLPHSITCIFFFSFILQHCLFTIVVFDDDNRGRKPKWFVVNQMIPFRWPSRSLEWGYVLISQFHSDCPMAQTQWHISGLNCTLHISVMFLHCKLYISVFCTALLMTHCIFLPIAPIKRVHLCTLSANHCPELFATVIWCPLPAERLNLLDKWQRAQQILGPSPECFLCENPSLISDIWSLIMSFI